MWRAVVGSGQIGEDHEGVGTFEHVDVGAENRAGPGAFALELLFLAGFERLGHAGLLQFGWTAI